VRFERRRFHFLEIAWRLGLVLAAGLPNSGCERTPQSAPPVDVAWTLRPEPAAAGPTTVTLTLRDRSGAPVRGARVRLEGHMSHAGMAPVQAEAAELAPGIYEIPFSFSMPGDWILLLSAVMTDGTRLERRIDVAHVRPSG